MTYLRTLRLFNGNTIQISRQKNHPSSVEITLSLLRPANTYDDYDIAMAKAEGYRMQARLQIDEVLNAKSNLSKNGRGTAG